MITKHILKTDFGVKVELHFNEETGHFNCMWEGLPKKISQALRDKILNAYMPWRDQILGAWAKRTSNKVVVTNV
jgi:hypothetical protein